MAALPQHAEALQGREEVEASPPAAEGRLNNDSYVTPGLRLLTPRPGQIRG